MRHWHPQEFTYDILIPKLDKSIFALTEEEAEAYFQWFMERVPERVAYVSKVCASELGISEDRLDCSPESLVLLWRWFILRGKTETVPEPEDRQLKNTQKSAIARIERQLTLETEYIIRDIGMYFGETLRKNNSSLYWTYYTTPTTDFYQNHPLLMGFISRKGESVFKMPFEPIHMAHVQGVNLLDNSAKETDLLKVYNFWTSRFISDE
jgi:hypothetical protein